MLCKTTMRAALAPVIGLFGVLGATTAGAAMDLTGDKAPTPLAYAVESLHEDYSAKYGGLDFYKLKATVDDLVINATTDILLPTGTAYYVRYSFGGGQGAVLTRALMVDDVGVAVDPAKPGTAAAANAIAYQGGAGQSDVMFQLKDSVYPIGTLLTLDLSRTDATADDDGRATDASAMLAVRGAGAITVSVAIYDSLQGARAETGALFSADGTIITVSSAVSASITSASDTADVGTPEADGGPFRRFVAGEESGGTDSGVLGSTSVSVNGMLKDAQTGVAVTEAIISHTTAVAASAAGNFAVSLGAGGTVNTKARNPWMLSSGKDCKSGPLTLGVANGTLETYAADPDGSTGPLRKGDLTPAGIQAATMASGNAANATGTNYFCVLVTGNEEPIPEIGDPEEPEAYSLTVTPVLTDADKRAATVASTTKSVGAIDHNGTTVHLAYISTHEAYNQRLVLVNRGGDAAKFWIEDTSFNLEDGTTLAENNLSPDMDLSVPANGRLVIRVQDNVTFDGMTRGAATVNVAAPKRNIDVMTIQVHPGTGQIDTTIYQNE